MSDAENPTTPKQQPDPRALNAYRHGITSRARFCAPEDEADYARHCKGYAASWSPAGDYEIDLCRLASDITWRLKIAGAMQEVQQAEAMAAPVVRPAEPDQAGAAPEYNPVWKECDKQLDLLSTYERRLHRNLNDTIKLLQDAQDRRKNAEREKERRAAQAETFKAQQEAVLKRLADRRAAHPLLPPGLLELADPRNLADFDVSKKSAPAITTAPTPLRT